VDEVWAPTRFIARALGAVIPVPVLHMPPGVEVGPAADLPRSHFGLAPDKYLFLFMFDMGSVLERKNPLGLIRAYRQAFGGNRDTQLVIKVSWGDANPAGFQQLTEAAGEAGVTVIDRVMSRAEAGALMNVCDCYVSLHRSEGFGFPLAEAMLLGKPVIATGYSGNLDFMTADNSLLVGYRRVPITQKLPFYHRGAVWAEPSVEEAAGWMRWAADHPEEARALGARARAEAGRRLSVEAAGRRMRARLEEISRRRGKSHGKPGIS
jgi:glycosyltransferase involved in cell wall biosynthesis